MNWKAKYYIHDSTDAYVYPFSPVVNFMPLYGWAVGSGIVLGLMLCIAINILLGWRANKG